MILLQRLFFLFFPLFLSAQGKPYFENLSAERTGIYFNNIIEDDDSINLVNLPILYNGAGVAIGDIDRDGLADVFLTSNRYQSKLYKNMGNFHFRDITATAQVGNRPNFYYTGVSMVDINQDGWLDIYLCKSSMQNEDYRRNELYINNRDGTFTEKAQVYGLDDAGYGHQAYFSDIDLDGDIDMFVLNQPFYRRFQDQRKTNTRLNAEGNMEIVLDKPTEYETNKLYINTNGLFKDVTAEAGLESHAYGLSAIIEDFNGDNLPDIHVCNDFKEHDVLYINKGKNTFIEKHAASFHHHSHSAMGSDYADFNNDGLCDLVTLDMLPEEISRYKQLRNGANYDQVNFLTKYGYGTQFEKNTLQKNMGNGAYIDIGFAVGIARTDWSWTPLLADFDNDGYKDLYITNGNVKDLTDEDFHNFTFDSINKLTIKLKSKTEIQNLYSSIPSLKVKNYFFKNLEGKSFLNASNNIGLDQPSWSYGAAYGDLDNDGDLDIIINNANDQAFIHKNLARENGLGNSIRIKLIGAEKNKDALGAKIEVIIPNHFNQTIIVNPYKGYLSSHDLTQVIGLDTFKFCDIQITWPDGKMEELHHATANKFYLFNYKNAIAKPKQERRIKPLFEDISSKSNLEVVYRDNSYIDYRLEPLLPFQLSKMGPCISSADLNGDGLSDIVLGGAVGFATSIYFQNKNGSFDISAQAVFEIDKHTEDGAILLEDCDGDGDKDILIACGGNEFSLDPSKYLLKYYINEGNGQFKKVELINNISVSSHNMVTGDFNRDGIWEVFIGARSIPGHYGRNPTSYLIQIQNDSLHMIDSISPIGMVSAASVGDINKDGWPDLIIGGEWQPIRTCLNDRGKIKWDVKPLPVSNGWWRNIQLADLDNDGDLDIIAGNHGLNSQYRGNEINPLQMHVNDFDKNGSTDIAINTKSEGKYTPIATRANMVDQMPYLKKKYNRTKAYSIATMEDIFDSAQLASSSILRTNEFNSCVFLNEGNQYFSKVILPIEAQYSSANGIVIKDINRDKLPEIILAGNTYAMEIETGQNDAGTGLILENRGKGNFRPQTFYENGLYIPGDVKCLLPIEIQGKFALIAAKNGDRLQVLKLKNDK